MRAYELMIIFDGDLEEEAVAASLSKATATIDRNLRLADRSEVVRHKIIRLPDSEVDRRGLLGEGEPATAG